MADHDGIANMDHQAGEGAVTAAVQAYWATDLGCSAGRLFAEPFQLLAHGASRAGYDGAFALSREGAITVGVPAARLEVVVPLLREAGSRSTLEAFASALAPVAAKVIGPAWIGYAHDEIPTGNAARMLGPDDAAALVSLEQACSAEEWQHGGSEIGQPTAGVFHADRLVAVAGYEVWGETIAHIAVVTDPHFRGHGYGRAAVASVASEAQRRGLIPQYRTLEGNAGSMRIASALGFRLFARSIAVRFTR
jgi:GNAT superfamily N-acetyltransferase